MIANNALTKIKKWDQSAILWIRKFRYRGVTGALKVFTYSGTSRSWWLTAIALYILQYFGVYIIPNQDLFLRALICPLIAWAVGDILKRMINRPRPADQIEGFVSLVNQPDCRSFPSTHASSTVALAMALWITNHPWALGVTVWSVIVSFSRFYLGVHFLTDLIGGTFLGILCGYAILLLTQMPF